MNLQLDCPASEMSEVALNVNVESHLNEKVIEALEDNGNCVTLREKSANMRVKVVGLSESVTAIRLGSTARRLSHIGYLKDGTRKKICDYLLLGKIGGEEHAIFIELKKNLGSSGNPEEQLLRSLPLLEYLLSVCDVEKGRKATRPRICYALVFDDIRLLKPSLRPNPSGMIDEVKHKTIKIRRFRGKELNLSDIIGL